jgi:hypothetical protein
MNNQPQEPDGWDLWQWVSYASTGLSALSLTSKGKQTKQFGQWGTVLGLVSTAAHKLIAPPRCLRCQCRMTRMANPSAALWICQSCGTQQA